MKLHAILEAKYHIGADQIELTQAPRDPKLHKKFEHMVNNKWWRGVMYKGGQVYEMVYKNEEGRDALEQELRRQNEDVLNFSSQETYLGYIPSLDMFIMGWDTWGEEEVPSHMYNYDDDEEYYDEDNVGDVSETTNLLTFKINNGRITAIEPYHVGGHMVYSDHQREKIRREHPDLVDVRLD